MSESESADATTAGSTSVLQFCFEGYVNTPELSAGRGGGLIQGLPANGPHKSLFRAGSRPRSESRASASNHHKTSAAPASSLHVLAEAAQSPEAISPILATASPQPTPYTPAPAPAPAPTSDRTSKKHRRKPSPLIESTSPVAPLNPISATRSSPVASSSSSQSHIIIDLSPPLCHPRTKSGSNGNDSGSTSGKQRVTLPSEALGHGSDEGGEQRYERGLLHEVRTARRRVSRTGICGA
jgi:hypothetical protein